MSAAFLVAEAAADAVEVGLVDFFPLVDLFLLPRFLPPGVDLPDSAGFLLLVVDLAGCFLAAGFWAALVQAATALVRADVCSTSLSCAVGNARGPTRDLKDLLSEKSPLVLTSDCRREKRDSGAYKEKINWLNPQY